MQAKMRVPLVGFQASADFKYMSFFGLSEQEDKTAGYRTAEYRSGLQQESNPQLAKGFDGPGFYDCEVDMRTFKGMTSPAILSLQKVSSISLSTGAPATAGRK